MPPIRLRALLALLLLLPAACSRDEERPVPPSVAEAFAEIPFPPNPSYVSRSGGEGALTLSLRSDQPIDVVVAHYRRVLGAEPWRLRSDAKEGEDGRVFYAEQGGRPLWVRLRPEGPATLVDLTGAVPKRMADSLRALGDSGR